MTFTATPADPVTIYYCKAGIQTGQTIRVLQGRSVHQGASVELRTDILHPNFDAAMTHDNAKGKPKASGARCVLIITRGFIILH